MRNLLPLYKIEARMSIQRQAQYRGAAFVSILGFLIEPIVYLIVWRTVAEQAGAINGYGVSEFTSYYIVWTLVRVFNLALAPGAWDWWVSTGRIANDLLHPVDPYHRNMAGFAGSKIVWIALWIPVAVVLVILFRPDFSPNIFEGATFFVAAWAGYVIRFNLLWLLGVDQLLDHPCPGVDRRGYCDGVTAIWTVGTDGNHARMGPDDLLVAPVQMDLPVPHRGADRPTDPNPDLARTRDATVLGRLDGSRHLRRLAEGDP